MKIVGQRAPNEPNVVILRMLRGMASKQHSSNFHLNDTFDHVGSTSLEVASQHVAKVKAEQIGQVETLDVLCSRCSLHVLSLNSLNVVLEMKVD